MDLKKNDSSIKKQASPADVKSTLPEALRVFYRNVEHSYRVKKKYDEWLFTGYNTTYRPSRMAAWLKNLYMPVRTFGGVSCESMSLKNKIKMRSKQLFSR